jgi:hypothetical protein
MTIHDMTNAYGHFRHVDLEDMNAPPTGSELADGTWVPGDSAGKFIVRKNVYLRLDTQQLGLIPAAP